MGYPQLSNRFSDRVKPPEQKEIDKTKLWYEGWQGDARQQIFEDNHYPKPQLLKPT